MGGWPRLPAAAMAVLLIPDIPTEPTAIPSYLTLLIVLTTGLALIFGWLLARIVHQQRSANSTQTISDSAGQPSEQRAADHLHAVSEGSLAAFYTIQDNVFLYANAAMHHIFGYEPGEIEGRLSPSALVHPDDWEMVRTNIVKRLRGELDSLHYTFRGVRKNGEVIYCEVLGSSSEFNGRPAVTGTLLDVTKEHAIRARLEKEHQLLTTLMVGIPDHIYFKDENCRFVRINPAQAEMLGLDSPANAIGHTDFDYFPQEQAEQAYADDRRVIDNHEPVIGKVERMRHSDGRDLWLSTTKLPLPFEDGKPAAMFGITRDISGLIATEEALRRSEVRYRALAESSPVGIWHTHADGCTLYANPTMCTILGVECTNSLEGCSHDEFFTPESALHLARKRGQYYGPEGGGLEATVIRPSGEKRHVLVYGAPIEIGGGAITMIETYLDITERRQIEDSEQQQRTLTTAMREVAAVLSQTLDLDMVLEQILDHLSTVVPYDTASILLVEESVVRLARTRGYLSRNKTQQELDAFRMPLDALYSNRKLQAGEPIVVYDAHQEPGWLHLPETHWIRSHVSAPITVDGRAIGFIGADSTRPDAYTEDDAERLRAFADQASIAIQNARLYQELETYSSVLEEAVEESTAELRQTVESLEAILRTSPAAILILDTRGLVASANPAVSQMFGLISEEVEGLSPISLAVPPDMELVKKALDKAWDAGETARVTFVARRTDRPDFDATMAIAPIMEHDRPIGAVCNVWDISAIKEIERMKESFVSMAAHELRTPLTSIQGFSELLLSRTLDKPRRQRYLSMIHEQARHLSNIIENLLDVSKLEARRGLDLHAQAISVATLAAEVVQPFAEISSRHHFRLEGLAGVPDVMADPMRLAQVLRNLISNAVKYSPDGGDVTLSAEVQSGMLAISVSDQGIGILPKQRTQLFQKFYRADTSNTAAGGTGLGLTICRMIVTLHGGKIWVEPPEQTGTTFTFTLPLARTKRKIG